MSTGYFNEESINFLYSLAANNNREWFTEHKSEYESFIREPAIRLIEAAEPELKTISNHFVANPKKVGGSLMRVYRDTRFSRDKTPYKTNIGIQFRHEQGKDVHAPGFYLHVGLDEIFIGVGIWKPDTKALAKIREAIDCNSGIWKRGKNSLTSEQSPEIPDKSFGLPKPSFELVGDSLKRPPKGYDRDHPLLEDLKRKDFIAVKHLSRDQLLSPDYLQLVFSQFSKTKSFMKFLCKALELPF